MRDKKLKKKQKKNEWTEDKMKMLHEKGDNKDIKNLKITGLSVLHVYTVHTDFTKPNGKCSG